MQIVRYRRSFVVLFLLAVPGCGGSGITDNRTPEDRGAIIVDRIDTGFNFGDPVWTKDGTEHIFIANGLKAVNHASHAVRVLDAGQVSDVARGVNGEWIYFTAAIPNPGGGPNVRLARAHPATGIVETVSQILSTAGGGLVVSADERWVAAGGRLFDMQNGTSRSLPGGTAHAFSPDGTRLLYVGFGSTTSGSLISTADLSSQPLPAITGYVSTLRWVNNIPQLLQVRTPTAAHPVYDVLEIDALTEDSHTLATFPDLAAGGTARWSDDGQKLGMWIQTELGPQRNSLAIIRPGAGPVMTLRVDADVGAPVFSPSGNSLIYTVYTPTGLFTGLTAFYLKTGI